VDADRDRIIIADIVDNVVDDEGNLDEDVDEEYDAPDTHHLSPTLAQSHEETQCSEPQSHGENDAGNVTPAVVLVGVVPIVAVEGDEEHSQDEGVEHHQVASGLQ